MPNLEEHCERTKRLYKVEGRDIHSWIDKPSKRYVSSHRQFRHDTETVRLVGKIFGNKYGRSLAENIALDHIMADHEEEIRQRQEATKELEEKTEEQSSRSEGIPITVRMQFSPSRPVQKSQSSLLLIFPMACLGFLMYMTLAIIPCTIFRVSGDILFNPLIIMFFTAIFTVILLSFFGSLFSAGSPSANDTSPTFPKKRQFPTLREIFSDEKPPQFSSVRKSETKDTGWICSNKNCPNVEYFSPNSICPSCGSKTEEQHWSASLLDSKFALKRKSELKQETQQSCSHSNVVQIPVFDVNGEPRRVIKKCAICGKVIETIDTGR